ncbi:MAG: CDGSH iron-sulfur domain-containing protein [Prosthecobacter sp.]
MCSIFQKARPKVTVVREAALTLALAPAKLGHMETLPKIHDKQPVAVELPAGDHWWCACGLSGHQPNCDGSHKGTGFGPKKFTLPEAKKVWLCNCKHTKNPPFCDGSHKAL